MFLCSTHPRIPQPCWFFQHRSPTLEPFAFQPASAATNARSRRPDSAPALPKACCRAPST
eukprot:364672-Chlamydomonas_euryale.AAC.5